MLIDKIFDRYYYPSINKYIIFARIKVDGVFRFERLYFNTEGEMKAVEEGDTL